MFTGVTFSKPPTFGIKTFHCAPCLIRIALSILTEEALVPVPQWLALAALAPGSSWQSWCWVEGCLVAAAEVVSPMNGNIDGICTTRYAILKNYRPYPLNYPLANTLLPKEIFKKTGCWTKTTLDIKTTWGVPSDDLSFTVFDISFG